MAEGLTDSEIYIDSSGGTITFSIESEPTKPWAYGRFIENSSNKTWFSASTTQINEEIGTLEVTIKPNDEIYTREVIFSLSSNTGYELDYDGTASATSAYTITQECGTVDMEVVMVNNDTNEIIFIKDNELGEETYPKEEWTPIGITVIPEEHGVLKDGTGTINQRGIISLMAMDYDNPENGGENTPIAWGGGSGNISGRDDGLGRYDSVTDGLVNYENVVIGGTYGNNRNKATRITSFSVNTLFFLPLQKEVGENPSWGSSQYTDLSIPSPYAGDDLNSGPHNEEYSTTRFDTNKDKNALADFGGIVNTKIITDMATGDSEWRTADKIDRNYKAGYFPAACCCARYKTVGTKAFVDCSIEELRHGTGFWYFPAIGELGYIIPRAADINEVIKKIKKIYDIGAPLDDGSTRHFWSSTENEPDWSWIIATTNGCVSRSQKKTVSDTFYDNFSFVRAFMRL